MKKLLFVFNPHSGRAQIKNNLLEITDIFTKAGYDATVYPTQEQGDCMKKVAADAGEYDRVVVSGGDGTLNEAVSGILQNGSGTPLGYIPTGTVNDFSANLKITKDMQAAAQIAVSGDIFECDICRFNDRTYNYVAAFGAFTEVSYETPQETKNIFGQVAYFVEGIKKLSSIQKYHAKVRYDGLEIEDDFMLGMVLNSKSVAGFELKNESAAFNTIELDDGLFEGILVRMPTNLIEFQMTVSDFLRDNLEGDRYVTFKTDHIEIEFDEPVKWALDGEFGGKTKNAQIDILPKAVKFIVNKENDSE